MLTLILLLFGFGGIIYLVSVIWTFSLAFQRSWRWGVPMLLLFLGGIVLKLLPQYYVAFRVVEGAGALLYIAFLVAAWEEAKRPFYWRLVAILLFVIGGVMVFMHSSGKAPLTAGSGKLEEAVASIRSTISHVVPSPSQLMNRTPAPSPAGGPPPPNPLVRKPIRPGIFYMLERVENKNGKGVVAANPGEEARLLERLPNKRLRVLVDDTVFFVNEDQVTEDPNRF